MSLEIGSFINDLTPSNPLSSDPAGQGDDHLRLIKSVLQGTLPNMGAVLGQARRQDTALSISSTWNTNHFYIGGSATATVVLTLPPASSITAGFYVDFTTVLGGTASILPSGAASINGGVALSVPTAMFARATFLGGTAWQADLFPSGFGGAHRFNNLTVDGTLSVSGASVLANLSVAGTLSVSAATVLNAVTVNGIMSISGGVHMKTTLSVSGATTLNAVTIQDTLQVNGVGTFKSGVSVSGATVLNLVTIQGNVTISGTVNLLSGQIRFPVSQIPSADANTLDDYEEGTFSPTLTFSTPGDLSVVYSNRVGLYTKIGDTVSLSMRITTTTFTWTTSSSTLSITGMPFGFANVSGSLPAGSIGFFQGMTGLGTDICIGMFGIANTTAIAFNSYSVVVGTLANITTAFVPSGSQKDMALSITYKV